MASLMGKFNSRKYCSKYYSRVKKKNQRIPEIVGVFFGIGLLLFLSSCGFSDAWWEQTVLGYLLINSSYNQETIKDKVTIYQSLGQLGTEDVGTF